MIRILLLLIFFSSIYLFGQQHLILVDTTSNCFYIDESTPLPFSPDLSLKFGIPDSAHVIVEVHKVISKSNSVQIMKTVPIRTIVDTILGKGKYKALWNGKDSNGKNADKKGKYIYYLDEYRTVRTLNGLGYIKIEAKSKVTFPYN